MTALLKSRLVRCPLWLRREGFISPYSYRSNPRKEQLTIGLNRDDSAQNAARDHPYLSSGAAGTRLGS
ncbi:hypothetical protein GWI33_001619 [Rhynchophorus ferrugineus]|uniref:Uncharacterized protein n=1 Tax=Rhynchophorus ferrugineus TaxID=354439 RepID=A0A834MGA1_RHYFE|nr:hypothetical protein GWI33_001619 [Rhynchophorus ferrugineus]